MAIPFLPNSLIEIASNGGGLDIDCSERILLPETMIAIARAAAASGKKPTITFRNMTIMMPDVASRIAAAGQGCVVFVI
ncbi:hypothetical protein IB265_24880 [Ensifer sp. ENS10]|uniref:hypothetical protein n=1 Tax=unclassified Ensifer TaxID=2633371 RepID=UPI00177A7E0F|nr:hypothetical protein [Ensifer sp. ENS10]MBD9510014.1 hypothetical protein [Ensifer sp. ENS10]